jgi:hypothetical protein
MPDALKHLHKLTHLRLSNNKINKVMYLRINLDNIRLQIQLNSFNGLENLVVLSLNSNPIQTVTFLKSFSQDFNQFRFPWMRYIVLKV